MGFCFVCVIIIHIFNYIRVYCTWFLLNFAPGIDNYQYTTLFNAIIIHCMKPNNILNKILKLQGMTCCLSVLMSWLAMVTLNAQTVTQTMYIDFGANNNASRGMLTTGADSNGNYWTNVHCGSSSNYIFPGTVFDVVNSSNDNTGYQVVVNVRFTTNGKSGGGGLLNPSADLLGDLAVASATEDYIFPESHQDYVYFTFRGLDPNKGYRFYSFGSRTSTADRVATFVFQGENIWQGNHQMSGSGIGTDGSNANNSTIQVSDVVFPDREGKITMTIVKLNKTGYVHLNAMKVEELSGLTRPNTELSLSQKMFIDFGDDNSDTRGHQTLGPDDNGNTWNNIYPASSNLIAQGTQVALVNAANAPTGITATTGANMKTNGLNNGGMNNPSAEWLGDMAVKTATEDYMFIETSVPSTTVNFTGMNKNNCYKFYFFGSRSTTTNRDCFYTLNGQREWSTVHITSGSSIFNRFTHGLAFCFIQNGKGQAVQPGQIHGQIREGSIINAGTAGNMGADHNSFAPQGSNHNSAGGHQRGCDPAAEMAAATVVFIAMILGIGCEIRMPGPGRAALIISAAGVRIGNQDCHRGTGGTAFKNAADNPEGIRFLPGSGNTAGRTAKSQLGSDKFLIHRDAGRKAVDDRADFGSVAFTEQCDGEGSAKGVFHNNSHIFYS